MSRKQSMSPLSKALVCAVLQPALRSLLIFDIPFVGLQQVAQRMMEMAAQTGQQLKPVILSTTGHDDDLWGECLLPNSLGSMESHTQLFLPQHNAEETLLLIIPDLSELSLAAARASIMLMGAPVAHLERHGQRGVWSPHYYWLASCQQEHLGAVSPHLLDRFALRLSWQSAEHLALPHHERVKVLQSRLQQEQSATLPQLDTALVQQIKRIAQHPPFVKIPSEACDLIIAYQEGEVFHQRRELALARCALALAQFEGDTQLWESHIEQAAQLMGMQKQKTDEQTSDLPNREDSEPPPSFNEEYRESIVTSQPEQTGVKVQPDVQKKPLEVQTQKSRIHQAIDAITAPTHPYPEDSSPILREVASLQVPQRRFVAARSDRGPILGVEPSTTLHDLALVSTLMRACLFQAFRTKNSPKEIRLDWTDLRKYRRAMEPERLLLLLVDYTSVPLAQRQQALVPYLSQAYRERAGITIIKVGAATSSTKSDLRAERVSARNILVPIISEAIDAPAGNATPLAHGLELALQVMRHTLQHGRSTVHHITFVILSDGRGNVPLQASHSNVMMRPIARAGIEDALEQAQEIGKIKSVSSVVLSPQLRYYQDLPQRLADALTALLIILEDEEGEQV